MNSYNGFSGSQRMAAQRWLNAEYAAGRRERPTECVACGQRRGPIDAHAEDYSGPPFDKADEFPLCYRCHMMVHCRFGSPQHWSAYLQLLDNGLRFKSVGRNWRAIQTYLNSPPGQLTLATATHLEERDGGDARILRAIAYGQFDPRRSIRHEGTR